MSYKRVEFLVYLKINGLKSGRSYCSYLGRAEKRLGYDIDSEYEKDRCAGLFDKLKSEFDATKTNNKRLHKAIGRIRTALKKYTEFRDNNYVQKDLPKIDWSLKDTMIGTVRDAKQLEFILKYNCYYVPAYFIDEDKLHIKYIALHEQGIGSEPGIRRFGRVLASQILKRSRIPVPMSRGNGDQMYIYFKVEGWDVLPHSITIRDTHRGAPLFTNKFLLDNCTQSYQLFSVSSDNDYLLMSAINQAFDDIRDSDSENFSAVHQINKAYTLTLSEGYLTVRNKRKKALEKISVGSYCYRPKDGFEKLKKIITK